MEVQELHRGRLIDHLQVAYHELQMVDQPAAVQFLDFHVMLRFSGNL